MASMNGGGGGVGGGAKARHPGRMNSRTDENAPHTMETRGHIAAKSITGIGGNAENSHAVPTRALMGIKVYGTGLKGGAKRAALEDISNHAAPGAKSAGPRQPLATLLQSKQNTTTATTLDRIQDAEIIVIDSPEKQAHPQTTHQSLETQFTEVEDEYYESKSVMDIDSDDPTTEPDDTDTDATLNSKKVCIPTTTRQDREELRVVRNNFAEEFDPWDISMVPEYADDIFRYMRELEFRMTPNPHYMSSQRELSWHMRRVLVDWIIQVHSRFHLLPETLFLTINLIDRFLTLRNVTMPKLQLVGAAALFIASKYEEITCPSVDEIVFMVDNTYDRDEILEAERFMVNMLGFELGWPGPMSFLRRISKADDYDVNTRTLSKYLLEVTIMDERFVASPPSYLAAVCHSLARRMLNKGPWTEAHMFYSGYTWRQIYPTALILLDCVTHGSEHHPAVFEKYYEKKFKRASRFIQDYMSQGQYMEITEENMVPRDDESPD